MITTTVVIAAAVVVAVGVLVAVRLAQADAEARRRGHKVIRAGGGARVYSDARWTEFREQVEQSLEDEKRAAGQLTAADARLIAARRASSNIRSEVAR